MATPEEIRKKLETQAGQRVNPLLKGLSMLTGGIAGEFTGTNEQIRQQRTAKRALMEEDLAALQEERLMERVKSQQAEMLKRQLELEAGLGDHGLDFAQGIDDSELPLIDDEQRGKRHHHNDQHTNDVKANAVHGFRSVFFSDRRGRGRADHRASVNRQVPVERVREQALAWFQPPPEPMRRPLAA